MVADPTSAGTRPRRSGRLADGQGRVDGVVAESPDRSTRFSARSGVVIASGGFSRSRELLSVFAPEQLAAIPYGGLGTTGHGLRMA